MKTKQLQANGARQHILVAHGTSRRPSRIPAPTPRPPVPTWCDSPSKFHMEQRVLERGWGEPPSQASGHPQTGGRPLPFVHLSGSPRTRLSSRSRTHPNMLGVHLWLASLGPRPHANNSDGCTGLLSCRRVPDPPLSSTLPPFFSPIFNFYVNERPQPVCGPRDDDFKRFSAHLLNRIPSPHPPL